MKDLNARAFAWRGLVAAVVGGSVMFGSSMVARADDVYNTLDGTIDATVEVMNLTAGGANGSTQLKVDPAGSDGKSGCNLTGQTTLGVSVNSSNAAVATVSPSSVTFTSCGDVKSLTVTPVGAGSATVSLTETSNNTGGTFNLAPATFTVSVAPATPTNTPPSVSVTGVSAGATYEHGAVPPAGCSASDAQDGNSSFAATLSAISGPLSGFGLGSQTATCSYTDQGGLSATATAAYTIVDTGRPVIELKSRTPGANADGWNNTAVTVEWSCTDAVSGVAAGTVSANVTAEGSNQDATGTCTDGAGNKASATEIVSIDKTAPTIAFESRTPAGPGWSKEDVVVTWTCTDALSGVVDQKVSKTIDADGADQSATGTCTDKAGNTSTSAPVGDIDVDHTPPTITLKSRTPANANGWNNTDVTVVWECNDLVSGVAADTITKTLGTHGANQSLTGTCTDGAGNTASATETNINIDQIAPTTTFVSRDPAGDGWTNKDVVVTWSCTDGGSGVVSPTVTATIDSDGADNTATGTCRDLAGNESSASEGNIKVDKTPPTITFVEKTPANTNGWNNDTVTVEWACTDAVNGSGVVASSVTKELTNEGADQSAKGSCTDNAGNTASDTQTGINIDLTAPALTSTRTVANGNGWNNGDVTVTWACTDNLSGVDTFSPKEVFKAEGKGQVAEGSCTDKAGNTDTGKVENINIDLTAPTLTGTRTAANGNGWNNGDVTVTWDCTDNLSGVDSHSEAETFTAEGKGQVAEGTCTDKAGNTDTGKVENINIDKTAPSIAWTAGPADGSSYAFGSVPTAKPTCEASDALSGVSGCSVSGFDTTVGTHTLTASATDAAGNTATKTRSYTVQAWTLKGVYQPVDMNGVWNTVKGGSTVPLKFEVFAGSTELINPAIATFSAKGVTCGADLTDDIEVISTGGTSLRYDSAAGQFIQNWQTPKSPGNCYKVTMTTTDGSSITANFKLK